METLHGPTHKSYMQQSILFSMVTHLGRLLNYVITDPLPELEGTPPRWMLATFELCTHNSRTLLHQQLATNEFQDKIHYVPYQQFRGDGSRVWSNLMSADWVAKQAVIANFLYCVLYSFLTAIPGSDCC